MTTTNRDTMLATPDVPWASEAIELVFTQESRSVANHSARSWIFACMLRDHLNLTQEVDETLLFAATLLHDIGLRRDVRDPVRFEIDGADRAAEFLTAQGLDAAQVDKVWEAIALHTSPGIPERRGPLTFSRQRRCAQSLPEVFDRIRVLARPEIVTVSVDAHSFGRLKARRRCHRRRGVQFVDVL